jgi:Tfp pilus assembly protein PilF
MYKSLFDSDEVLPEAHFNGGFFFLKQHNYEHARHHFSRFVEEGTDEDKIEEARRVVSEIDNQDLLDNLFKEAYDFIKLGKEQEGIQKISDFLQHHPDVWNAWFLLGWGYRRTGQFEKGKEAFLKALELGPEQVDTLNELAICLMETGELDRSRARLERAIRLEPDNTKVMSNLGIVAMKQEKLDEAEGYFHSVLDLAPEDPIARHYLELIHKQGT